MGNLFSSGSKTKLGKGTTYNLTSNDIVNIVKSQAFLKSTSYLFVKDRDYIAVDEKRFKEFTSNDNTNSFKYVTERSDCDDFSNVFMGRVSENIFKYGSNGNRAVAIGIITGDIYKNSDTPVKHAMNIVVVNRNNQPKVLLYEPQNDKLYEPDQRNNIWMVYI